MKLKIINGKILFMMVMLLLTINIAIATTCSVTSSATVPVSADEDITVTCSEIGSGKTVTISPSGFSSSCITLDSASKQVSASNPTTTFTTTGVSLACMMNVPGRTVTWTFTHSGGNNVASKTTVYNVIPTPSITPTFNEEVYSVENGTNYTVNITLALTTSQSQIDIRNIDVFLTTSFNGTELGEITGLMNKTDLTIDVSESTTQYVTWQLELPPLPGGATYDFNVSVSADNANSVMGDAIINVTTSAGETTISYNLATADAWYLISVPTTMADSSVSAVFSNISGSYEVWGWNDGWQYYISGFGGALSTIDADKGYWIKPTQTSSFSAVGTIADSTDVNLVADWNLIGYPAATADAVESVFSSVSGSYEVWGWNDGWQYYISGFGGALSTIDVGKGYWIQPAQLQTITIS